MSCTAMGILAGRRLTSGTIRQSTAKGGGVNRSTGRAQERRFDSGTTGQKTARQPAR